jgi:beta-N-acetylhexosaminidase
MREAAASIVVGSLGLLEPSKEELRFLSRERVPGVVLFKRNIPPSLSDLTNNIIQALYASRNDKTPLFIAIDQEGGRVSRLDAPFPNEGCALRVGNTLNEPGRQKFIYEYGKSLGLALRDLHINVNFAPVVDILSHPLNIGVGDRAFGMTSKHVIQRAGAFLNGMQSEGVLGCLKHFPGQGSELNDPHHDKVVIDLSHSRLEKRELAPYRALLDHAKMVMVSHCIFPSLDKVPASLSHAIVTGLLRKAYSFQGLIVSDDMNMKAISQDPISWRYSIVQSVVAGCNLILVCSHLDNWIRAIDALEAEGRKSESFANLLYASAEKVQTFRKNFLFVR